MLYKHNDTSLSEFLSLGVSTHVLDTSIGQPGGGINLKVYYQAIEGPVADNRWNFLRSA